MVMIRADRLARIRTLFAGFNDVACVIQRQPALVDRAQDLLGTPLESWTPVATTTCHLRTPSAQMLNVYADALKSPTTWQVRLADGQDVRLNDQIIAAGLTMRVDVLLNPQSYSTQTNVLAGVLRGSVDE